MVWLYFKLRKTWNNLVDMVVYKRRRLCNLTLKWIGCFLNCWNKFIIQLYIKLHHVWLVIRDKLLNWWRGHGLINILLYSLHIWILELLILLILLILPVILIINSNLASDLLLILLLICLRALILRLFFLEIFILYILLVNINRLLRIILSYLCRNFRACL